MIGSVEATLVYKWWDIHATPSDFLSFTIRGAYGTTIIVIFHHWLITYVRSTLGLQHATAIPALIGH